LPHFLIKYVLTMLLLGGIELLKIYWGQNSIQLQ
jgi:hypothetical protein